MKKDLNNLLKSGVIVIIIVLILSSFGASGYHTRISGSEDLHKISSQLSSPDLIYPEDEAIVHDDTPTFRWSSVDDPSGISYTLEYSNDPTFQTSITVEDILINIYTVPIEEALDENIDYYWRVKAINGEGNVSEWSDIWQFILDLSLIVHTSTSDFESGTLTNLIAFDDEVKFASLVPSWNNRYNENIHDISRSVMVDDGNNVYITGSTGYLMYGDEGWTDFLTVKYDENGNILWNKTYNKSKWDMAYDVSSDSYGNLYVTGYSGESLFGFGNECVTIKYDENGEILWMQNYSYNNVSTRSNNAYSIVVDPSGDVYVMGSTYTSHTYLGDHILIIKYDEDGNELWSRIYDIWNYEYLLDMDVVIDSQGYIYVGSTIMNEEYSGRRRFSFIQKFDQDGNEIWHRRQYKNYHWQQHLIDMTIDSHDNIYYCTTTHTDDEWEWGEFRTTKRDSNGTKLWEKAFYHEFPYQHYARGIAIDSEDNIYVSGVKHSFNDPPRHFTVRYNPEGNLTWHHIYDSPGFESVVDNAMSKNDDLYIISNTELGGDEIDYQMVKYCTPAVGVITSSDLISSTQYLIGANATWNADVPEDTSITVEISNDAGISWHHVENGETIDFPEPGHILRYKLTFSTSNKTRTPVLYDITIHTTIDDNPPDDIPPTIAILKPENALYLRNSKILPLRKPLIIGTIDIEVAASDDQTGIERVEFFIDDELKETDITEPYNWTWDEKTRFRFRHTIKVIAYDEAGNYATSEISVRKFF